MKTLLLLSFSLFTSFFYFPPNNLSASEIDCEEMEEVTSCPQQSSQIGIMYFYSPDCLCEPDCHFGSVQDIHGVTWYLWEYDTDGDRVIEVSDITATFPNGIILVGTSDIDF